MHRKQSDQKAGADKFGDQWESRECYKSLQKHKMISHYHDVMPKLAGTQWGVVLFGKTSDDREKKVYVKQYRNQCRSTDARVDDLRDYAVFHIIKGCGGKVPKVKLKGTAKKVFLFSTDVQQAMPEHLGRQYQYFEFSKRQVSVDEACIRLHVPAEFNKTSMFAIDKITAARMLILGRILNLYDLHRENTGVVVSSENNAKLCFVDFSVRVNLLAEEKDVDFATYIRTRYSGDLLLDAEFCKMLFLLDEGDYLQAFQKIDENFHAACVAAKAGIEAMSFICEQRKQDFIRNILPVWQANFELVKKMVDQAKREQVSFRLK